MRHSLLLLCFLAAFLPAMAKDNVKIKTVNHTDGRPVPFATLAVEYPDTILNSTTDSKGRTAFIPRMYPFTVTASADGMLPSTVGLISRPKKTVSIELDPVSGDQRPASRRRPDWTSDTPPRFPSVFIVREKPAR